jgi:hypothetical protein
MTISGQHPREHRRCPCRPRSRLLPRAVDGIVRCDDGSIQYIDQRGHYICVAPNGIITCDIPPGQPRY